MDYSKTIASARQLSYLIVGVGLLAFGLAWKQNAEMTRWPTITYLEKVIAVSELLKRGGWNSGANITPLALATNFDDIVRGLTVQTNYHCAHPYEPPPSQRGVWDNGQFPVPPLYSFPSARFSQPCYSDSLNMLPGIVSSDPLRDARVFLHLHFLDNVPGCSAVIFRGTDDESYHLPVFDILGDYREIRNSKIYRVFFNQFCMPPQDFSYPPPFVLIDDTDTLGFWYCAIPLSIDKFVTNNLERNDYDINNNKLDLISFLSHTEHVFLRRQINELQGPLYVENLDSLYSRIIAELAGKEGIMYTRTDFDKAIGRSFPREDDNTNLFGVPVAIRVAMIILPFIMFCLTTLLWHSVKRIDFKMSPFEEPWVLLDIRGWREGCLAVGLLILMIASVLAVIWGVLVFRNATIPNPRFLFAFLKFLWNNTWVLHFVWQELPKLIKWDATVGTAFSISAFVPLLAAIHIIVKGECSVYRNCVARIRVRRRRRNG